MKLDLRAPEMVRNLLHIAGMPGYLHRERPFNVEDHVGSFTSTTEGMTPLRIDKQTQLDGFLSCLKNPTDDPYTLCISSSPNDLRAKYAAACVLRSAIDAGARNTRWHTLIGGYKDELRDKPKANRNISLLVLANVPYDSTPVKYEKLRDIIELYPHVPRIIVTTGCEPIHFFNTLGLPLTYPLWLRSKRCKRVI